jgi:murein tripeptide amidase MpaA
MKNVHKYLLGFSIFFLLGLEAHASKPIIQLKKDQLSKYASKNGLDNLDIHGIDYSDNSVVLQPNKQFMDFLNKNNIDYITRANLNERANISDYLRPDEIVEKLSALAENNPAITKFIEVGKTHQNRPIVGVEITKDFNIDKPVISFNGMHHARELMTAEVTLSIAEKLVQDYNENNEEVINFLETFKIVVVPQVNPDGNAIVHDRDSFWRKNARVNESGRVFGVDLNRNYPVDWDLCNGSSGRSSSQTYRGETPASEPETQAMIRFFDNYQPVANISYHAYSELIIYPFGCKRTENTATKLFHDIANEMNAVITNDRGKLNRYRVGTAPKLLYEADGTDLDTHWKNYGTISYTIELNSSRQGFHPAYQQWRDKTVASQVEGWKQLIRSSMKSAIKFIPSSDMEYIVKNSKGESFAGVMGPRTFKAFKGKIGYRVLSEGDYILEIYKDSTLTKTIPIKVDKGIKDLGVL